jgi:CheY-like chemotaxis protein/GAF domain-containing protein/HAMP domain-containing protein
LDIPKLYSCDKAEITIYIFFKHNNTVLINSIKPIAISEMKSNNLRDNQKYFKSKQPLGRGLKLQMIIYAFVPALIVGSAMLILLFSKFNAHLSSGNIVYFLSYLALAGVSTLATFISCFLIIRSITRPISMLSKAVKEVAEGKIDHEIKIKSKGEISELIGSYNYILTNLRLTKKNNDANSWLKSGQKGLYVRMRGEHNIESLSINIIDYLTEYLNAKIGILYMSDKHSYLKQIGSSACIQQKNISREIKPGEGLVGQVAMEKKHIQVKNYADGSIDALNDSNDSTPKNILIFPLILNKEVKGVLELRSCHEFPDIQIAFLEQVAEGIAVALNSVISKKKTKDLLEHTRQQTKELQAREEALRQSNEELEANASALKESESRLQAQKEKLHQINEELERQKEAVEEKNKDLNDVRWVIEEKARDLELSSKYKSEFLANMSHELRTPLNSILLLSKLLADNKGGNMTEDTVESAQSIYSSGSELLRLINDVLDLSKVEAGKMNIQIDEMDFHDFSAAIKRSFQPVTIEKKLYMHVDVDKNLPNHIYTDKQRLEQIVKNLLSNAFKFTQEGGITLRISRPDHHSYEKTHMFSKDVDSSKIVAFSVKDTGIGIPEEKQKLIFDAFQQADGTISRKYGGTGLGLSISKELAKLLEGEIHIESNHDKGSTFTLYLPETFKSEHETDVWKFKTHISKLSTRNHQPRKSLGSKDEFEAIEDDRKTILTKDRSILIIEDDPKFLKILRDLARKHGFKTLLAGDGKMGLHFADYYKPSGIILDVDLPEINGWTVMARLKDNPETRHIPVQFISAFDNKFDAIRMGAIDYITKPVSTETINQVFEKFNKVISKLVKYLLVVEDNPDQAKIISSIIGNGDVSIVFVSTAKEAYNQILSGKFDCMVLDITLPDMSGVELLNKIRNNEKLFQLPIIVYTGKELTTQDKKIISEYAETTIIKGVGSHRKLLDETTLFLHRIEANLPEKQQKILRMIHDKEAVLTGKKILVVDDDMRNVFSIKKVLEDKGMKILVGKNGKDGLACLNDNPDVHLVLMDIMMPEMDGYTAIEEIRKQGRFKNLPIIALTAKAMKGDRAKSIEAGASDYLAKPFEIDRIFSMLRVWLY